MSQKQNETTHFQVQFAEMGRKRIEDFVKVQTELLDRVQETNRKWFDRAQAEANLASEFASKLTKVHSLPEAMAIWQEWTGRSFEMLAEDGKHMLADTQKFMATVTHLMPNGGPANGGGGAGT